MNNHQKAKYLYDFKLLLFENSPKINSLEPLLKSILNLNSMIIRKF